MDIVKKIFVAAAFALFILALVWLFTYDPTTQPAIGNGRAAVALPDEPPAPERTVPVADEAESPTPAASRQVDSRSSEGAGRNDARSATNDLFIFAEQDFTRDGLPCTYTGAIDANGRFHGVGLVEYKNGNRYVGQFENGERSGYGNSIFVGSKKVFYRQYRRDQKDHLMNEERKSWKYGSKSFGREGQRGIYSGPMIAGKPEGFGVYRYQNGDVFIGEYAGGLRNGVGTFCEKNGECLQQVYVDGDLRQ